MNLYQTQRPFYCGIDRHANKMYACVVDSAGKYDFIITLIPGTTHSFLESLTPFCSKPNSLVVGCESTFSWYGLCDLNEGKDVSFLQGHALYVKANH